MGEKKNPEIPEHGELGRNSNKKTKADYFTPTVSH